MDAKTAEALEASIAKWERNAEAAKPSGVALGEIQCPLCAIFRAGDCIGCPVSERGYSRCTASPYDEASDRYWEWAKLPSNIGRRDAFRAAALAEVEFLKSLREPVAVEDAA